VPARQTRIQGQAAPEVYQGAVALNFADSYDDTQFEQYCED